MSSWQDLSEGSACVAWCFNYRMWGTAPLQQPSLCVCVRVLVCVCVCPQVNVLVILSMIVPPMGQNSSAFIHATDDFIPILLLASPPFSFFLLIWHKPLVLSWSTELGAHENKMKDSPCKPILAYWYFLASCRFFACFLLCAALWFSTLHLYADLRRRRLPAKAIKCASHLRTVELGS